MGQTSPLLVYTSLLLALGCACAKADETLERRIETVDSMESLLPSSYAPEVWNESQDVPSEAEATPEDVPRPTQFIADTASTMTDSDHADAGASSSDGPDNPAPSPAPSTEMAQAWPSEEVDGEPEASLTCDANTNKEATMPVSKVFYGTDRPSHIPLTPSQVKSVGRTANGSLCSGILITPSWVLTAAHCSPRRGTTFCVGDRPSQPNHCVNAGDISIHPSVDMALLELERPMTDLVPDIQPVPIHSAQLQQSWIGRIVEAAGYGLDENGDTGRREFSAQPLVALDQTDLVIDGQGVRGVCFGDSGGPVMAVEEGGQVGVLGVLSGGDDSCVGRDRYTRVDRVRDWILQHTGPMGSLPGSAGCGQITTQGLCSRDLGAVTYCGADETLREESCQVGEHCAWSDVAGGWRCLDDEEDHCDGIGFYGDCQNGRLSWCDRGVLKERDCETCGQTCVVQDEAVGYRCADTQCDDVPIEGICIGDIAEWCTRDGVRHTRDCRVTGQTCSQGNEESGYFCQPGGECGDTDYHGRCEGDVAVWCDNGRLKHLECSRTGRACRFVNDQVGYYCSH